MMEFRKRKYCVLVQHLPTFNMILQYSYYVVDEGDIHSKPVLSPLHPEFLEHQVFMSGFFDETERKTKIVQKTQISV